MAFNLTGTRYSVTLPDSKSSFPHPSTDLGRLIAARRTKIAPTSVAARKRQPAEGGAVQKKGSRQRRESDPSRVVAMSGASTDGEADADTDDEWQRFFAATPAGDANLLGMADRPDEGTKADTRLDAVFESISDTEDAEYAVLSEETLPPPADPGTCPICLISFADRPQEEKALLDTCLHSFCLQCISEWAAVSRACPLCKRKFEAAVYDIRGEDDFKQTTFPPPAPAAHKSSSVPYPHRPSDTYPRASVSTTSIPRPIQRWGGPLTGRLARDSDPISVDELAEATLDRRRHIYRRRLRLRHSRPASAYPTPALFLRDAALASRLTPFLRRELPLVLPSASPSTVGLVVEFFLGVAKNHDLRSDTAISALSEFLGDMTELLVNEALGYLAGSWDLEGFDRWAQYDGDVPSVEEFARRRRSERQRWGGSARANEETEPQPRRGRDSFMPSRREADRRSPRKRSRTRSRSRGREPADHRKERHRRRRSRNRSRERSNRGKHRARSQTPSALRKTKRRRSGGDRRGPDDAQADETHDRPDSKRVDNEGYLHGKLEDNLRNSVLRAVSPERWNPPHGQSLERNPNSMEGGAVPRQDSPGREFLRRESSVVSISSIEAVSVLSSRDSHEEDSSPQLSLQWKDDPVPVQADTEPIDVDGGEPTTPSLQPQVAAANTSNVTLRDPARVRGLLTRELETLLRQRLREMQPADGLGTVITQPENSGNLEARLRAAVRGKLFEARTREASLTSGQREEKRLKRVLIGTRRAGPDLRIIGAGKGKTPRNGASNSAINFEQGATEKRLKLLLKSTVLTKAVRAKADTTAPVTDEWQKPSMPGGREEAMLKLKLLAKIKQK